MTFQQKLESVQDKNNSLLCVGLDTDFYHMPERLILNGEILAIQIMPMHSLRLNT